MKTKKKHKPKFVTRKYARAYMLKSRDVYIEDLLDDDGEWICDGGHHKTIRQVDNCPYCAEYYRRMDELTNECPHPHEKWMHHTDGGMSSGDWYSCSLCGEITQVG